MAQGDELAPPLFKVSSDEREVVYRLFYELYEVSRQKVYIHNVHLLPQVYTVRGCEAPNLHALGYTSDSAGQVNAAGC